MKSPTRRRLAALAAVALGAGAVTGLAALPAQAQESTQYPIVDGSITWGVKESFRNYITGPIAGGEITLGGGAVEDGDGAYVFGGAAGVTDLGAQTYAAATTGSVHFYGHHGQLDLLLENLEFTADHATFSGEIIADVTSLGTLTEDVVVAEFDYSGVPSPWTNTDGFARLDDVPATLTAAGAEAFAGFYQAGSALDPVSIAIKTDMGSPGGEAPSTEEPSSEDPSSEEPGGEDPSGEPATVYEVTGGGADWGVKESYRDYVTGPIAHGEITVIEPASPNGDGTFHFPDASGGFTAETCALDASFAGGVNFYGHDGQMDLDVADLSVESADGALALYAGGTHIADVAVAELAVSGGEINVDGAAATVAAGGADFFAGFYPEGTALDPVSFTVELADAPDTVCEPTGNPGGGGGDGGDETSANASGAGSPKLPVTGSPLTLVVAAAVLLAGGAGAMVLARRRAVRA
ncbi:HtaA domain-containing protein [Glycomyces sp. A-F 0318]|uniref:HtaA domain-containing protein n=1 Tax=Glycomyces amatae TaxID=2881355 RepID=UPI001E35FFBF|nr:HtaA domain-containing protein [Glycomyces amatae]MCD0442943.1 HtaA domain-containing protein [Glycomyces amatae]